MYIDLRHRLAQRARCIREEQPKQLVFKWPLAQVVPGRYPALELRWTDRGDMMMRFHEHLSMLEPVK